MKTLWATLFLLVLILVTPLKAYAACTTSTVFLPDGSVMF